MSETIRPDFIPERYRDLAEIGKGGMGVVYRAHDTTLDRDVALKVILPHFSFRPDFKDSFAREARALANLAHPNIIPVYDFSSDDKGSWYVMALMTGKTLQQLLEEGALPAERFLETARSLLAALGHAHANNILHRDIKAANIFVNEDGHVFLGDFGVALPGSTEGSSLASQQFHFQGTPAYASPEQIEGHRLTPASDIYSLGILFYEMLSGALPFTGSLNSVLTGQLTRKPPRLDPDDPKLQHLPAIVARMLDKTPGNRPQNTEEVRNLLDHPELVAPLVEPPPGEEEAVPGKPAAALNPDQLALQLADRIKIYRSRYNDADKLIRQLETSRARIDKAMYRELKGKYAASLEENLEALEELFHQAETCITELELMLKHDQAAHKEIEGRKTELRFLKEGSAISDAELVERSRPLDAQLEDVQTRIEARSERLNRLTAALEKHRIVRVITPLEKTLIWAGRAAAAALVIFFLYMAFLSLTTVPGKIDERMVQLHREPSVTAPPAGQAWKDELVTILSVKQANPGEVITVRKTFLQTGGKLLELDRGVMLTITAATKSLFTVDYTEPGKGTIRGATISASSVRRNNWYRVRTAGGARGWLLAEGVSAWKQSSVFTRFVFNLQWFFGKTGRTRSKDPVQGQALTGTLPGKKGWEQTGDPKDGKFPLRFAFHLDARGAAAISEALSREIALAQLTGLESRANTLEELKSLFSDNDHAGAEKLLAGVSLVGPFNGWDPGAQQMKKTAQGVYVVYTVEDNFPCLHTNEAYGFIATLASADRRVQIFVPDPLAAASRLALDGTKHRLPALASWIPDSVTSSSEDTDHPVLNLSDDRTNTAWRSLPGKSGLDTRFEFKFPQKRLLRQIGIKNGAGTGVDLYACNRAARIQFAAGDTKAVFFLRDGSAAEQRFTLPAAVQTDRIVLVIEEIYPGSQARQAAITDVYFYY